MQNALAWKAALTSAIPSPKGLDSIALNKKFPKSKVFTGGSRTESGDDACVMVEA